MATRTTSAAAAAKPASTAQPDPQPVSAIDDTTPLGVTAAPVFFSVYSKYARSSYLSEDGKQYMNRVKEAIAGLGGRDADSISYLPIKTPRVEGISVVDSAKKLAINLLFGETYQATVDTSNPTDQTEEIYRIIQTQDPSIQPIETVTVDKPDYVKSDNMAAWCLNMFRCASSDVTDHLVAGSFSGNRFTVKTDINAVRDFIAKVSPHAIPARDDIGVLVFVEVSKTNSQGVRTIEQIPLFAATGYTHIMASDPNLIGGATFGDAGKFLPIVTITDIVSHIPSTRLLSIALPICIDAFITNQMWQRPYGTFKNDAPNIGNVLTLDGNKQGFCDNKQTFYSTLNTYYAKPFIALDVTRGRCRPLNIDNIGIRPQVVMHDLEQFVGHPIVEAGMENNFVVRQWVSITGRYTENGVEKDTRNVDFFNLATKIKDNSQIWPWLQQPANINGQIDAIKQLYGAATPLYLNTTYVLHSTVVDQIAIALANSGIRPTYDVEGDQNINLMGLTASNANQFGNTYGFRLGGVQQTNPYDNLFF